MKGIVPSRRVINRLPPHLLQKLHQRQRFVYGGISYSPDASEDENDDENKNEQKIVDESKEEKCEAARNPGPFKEDIQTVATFTSLIFADNQLENTLKTAEDENRYQDESSIPSYSIDQSLLNAFISPGRTRVASDEEDEDEKISKTANIKATFNQSNPNETVSMSSPEKTIRRPRRLVYRLPPMTQRQRLAYYGIPYSPETSADENDDENENEQKIVDESKEEKCEVARNPGPFKEDIQTVATFTSQIFADNQPGNTSKENCYQDESSFALHTIARSLLNAIILPGKTLVAFDEEDEEEKTSETANIKATFNQSPYKSDEIEATNCSEDKSHENSSSNHDMEVDQSLTPQAKADSAIPKKDEENKSSKQEVGEKQNDEPKEDKKIWPWLIKRDAKIQRIAEEKEKRGNPTMDDVLPDSESTKTSKGQTNTIFHSQPSRLALLFQRFPPVPSSRTTNQNIFSLLPDTSHQPRERILLTTKKTKGLYGKVLDQSPPTLDVSQFKNFQRGNSDDTANLQERQNFEKKRAHPLTPQRQQIEFTDDRNNESLVASRVPPKRLPPNAPPSENVLEEFKEYQRIEKSRPFCSSGGKRNHPSSAQQPKPTSKLDHSNKEYLYRTKALDLLQQYQSPVTPRVAEPSQFNKLQHVETSRLHNPASSNDPESQIHQDFGKFTSADEEEFSGSHSDESVKTISPSTPPSENVMEDVVLQTPSPPKETSSPQEDIPESLIDHDFGNDSFGDNESSRRFIRLNEVSPVTTAHELAHTPGNDDSKPSTPAASRSSPQKPISPVQQAQRPTRQRKKPVKFNDYIL